MTSRHLHELIDACRPGRDDVNRAEFSDLASELLRDPKLQQQFERSQMLDAAIRTKFQAVTPPPGLAAQLLEAIDATPQEAVTQDAVTQDATPQDAVTIRQSQNLAAIETRHDTMQSSVEPAKRSSRRWFSIAACAASLSAAAAIVFWLAMPQPVSDWPEDVVAQRVDQWNAVLDEGHWAPPASLPAEDFATWDQFDLRGVARWQWVSKGRNVCYDFAVRDENGSNREGVSVRLFVMKPASAVALPKRPPAGYPSPAGWHVGAWQANGRVYFLAVDAGRDSKRLYAQLVASPITPA